MSRGIFAWLTLYLGLSLPGLLFASRGLLVGGLVLLSGLGLYRLAVRFTAQSFFFLFYLLLVFFHLGVVIPLQFDDFDLPSALVAIFLDSPYYEQSLRIVLVAMCSFLVGSELAGDRYQTVSDGLKSGSPSSFRFWMACSFSFALVSIVLGLKYGIFTASKAHFVELDDSGQLRWFGLARLALIFSGFIALSYAPRRFAAAPLALYVLTTLPMLLFGKRGEFVVVLMGYLVAWKAMGLRVSMLKLGFFGIALLALSSVLRLKRGGEALGSLGLFDTVFEMGLQLRILQHTLDYLSHGGPLWLGASYYDALVFALPNVAGVHDVLMVKGLSPGQWVTRTYNEGGSGLGFSIIAEPYLNFGLAGVIGSFFGLPFLVAFLQQHVWRDRLVIGLLGVVSYAFFWAVRNDSWGILRPIIWYMCFCVGGKMLVKISLQGKVHSHG